MPIEMLYEWDFFLAHAGTDAPIAETLYELLKPYRTFLDTRNLLEGDDWDIELSLAQSKSLITVVLISSHTDNAYYQREEIAAAISMAREDKNKHRVIPIYLDDSTISAKKIPYGLRGKHSLDVPKEGGLENVANKLKKVIEVLRTKQGKSNVEPSSYIVQSFKFQQAILEAMARLDEDELISEVVAPLIQELHPGDLDHIRISEDDTKVIISSGIGRLKRPQLLCVQVRPITPDLAKSDVELELRTIERIKKNGVVREDGQQIYPNEYWLISPFAFNEEHRALLSEKLQDMGRRGIHFISGEQLCELLTDNLPDIATRLSKYSTPEIINMISALSKHNEGRAFGFSSDRSVTEFYVTTALSPYATKAYAAIRDDITVGNAGITDIVSINKLLKVVECLHGKEALTQIIKKRAVHRLTKGILDKFNVHVDVRFGLSIEDIKQNFIELSLLGEDAFIDTASFVNKLRNAADPLSAFIKSQLSQKTLSLLEAFDENFIVDPLLLQLIIEDINVLLTKAVLYNKTRFSKVRLSNEVKASVKRKLDSEGLLLINRLLLEEAYPKEISKNPFYKEDIGVVFNFDFESAYKKLVKDTIQTISRCPSVLSEDVSPVRKAWDQLELIERFIKVVSELFRSAVAINSSEDEDYVKTPIRIRIPNPEHLLKLDSVILVEGPAGCGKTTLLKILAIDILSKGGKVVYLPCFNIPPNLKKSSFENIVEKCSQGAEITPGKFAESILIVDGLDEAPFDISNLILSNANKFLNIVVSTRIAFETILRSEFFRVELSPFSDEDRDLFYQKWFNPNQELINQAKELILKYPDIDHHTRLPLIATITVVLLKNGIIPKTRAEIYDYRLELLLSKWDRLRGVQRLSVDNPDAKRRFLRQLAYFMHSSDNRRRSISINELKDVYENSLGVWGYNVNFDQVLKDLVVGSGILIEERSGTYSFGHLTFQEHLAGEYIAKKYTVEKIAILLNDDWWREPLIFYSSIQGDITELLDYLMDDISFLAYAKQLSEMVIYAPYTSPGAIQTLNDYLSEVTNEDVDRESLNLEF